MWHVLFRTVNLVNRKMFYGKHKTNDLFYGTADYTDQFIGSSKELLQDLSKLGRKKFYVEAIHAYTDEQQADEQLQKIVTKQLCEHPLIYNKMFEPSSGYTYTMSEDHKQAIANGHVGMTLSEEIKEKISETKSGTTWINDGTVDKVHDPELPIPEGWKQGRVYRPRNRQSTKNKSKNKNVLEVSANDEDNQEDL